jgi:hypothetical protein
MLFSELTMSVLISKKKSKESIVVVVCPLAVSGLHYPVPFLAFGLFVYP